jgi:hypothetical protein
MLDDIFPPEFEVPGELIEFIRKSKDRSNSEDYSGRSSLFSMFGGPSGNSFVKILPTLEEFERVTFFDVF